MIRQRRTFSSRICLPTRGIVESRPDKAKKNILKDMPANKRRNHEETQEQEENARISYICCLPADGGSRWVLLAKMGPLFCFFACSCPVRLCWNQP
mmetsp:Transcript_30632/g.50594  ORF Transcript_30632/g.50594 Transcript_30632/m.50594 type:complete len:96 (+) Transcript_30632:290-577(+)